MLVKLADYVNNKDYTAWPTFNTLAADCGVGRRTVIRAIDAGRRMRIIKCLYRGGKKRGLGISNRYIFIFSHSANLTPCQDDMVPTSPQHGVRLTPYLLIDHLKDLLMLQRRRRLETAPSSPRKKGRG